jgi:hypothetical protein
LLSAFMVGTLRRRTTSEVREYGHTLAVQADTGARQDVSSGHSEGVAGGVRELVRRH